MPDVEKRYLVELYVGAIDAETIRAALTDARSAEQASRTTSPVRLLDSVFVLPDETCLLIYDAESAQVLERALSQASVAFDRVVEAVQHKPSPSLHKSRHERRLAQNPITCTRCQAACRPAP